MKRMLDSCRGCAQFGIQDCSGRAGRAGRAERAVRAARAGEAGGAVRAASEMWLRTCLEVLLKLCCDVFECVA